MPVNLQRLTAIYVDEPQLAVVLFGRQLPDLGPIVGFMTQAVCQTAIDILRVQAYVEGHSVEREARTELLIRGGLRRLSQELSVGCF